MLYPHSLLWHYLWAAPNVLLLFLALRLWRTDLREKYPLFFVFAILGSIEQLIIYAADVIPTVGPEVWWRFFWVGLVVEGLLKFALIGEIFASVFAPYSALARLGNFLSRGIGIFLVLAASVAAALAPRDSLFKIVSGAHLLEQTIYLVESGLLVSIFLFSSYFHLRPARPTRGIALGLGFSSCVHLATWAVAANAGLPDSKRIILDFVNMAAYNISVLIWAYYLLVPREVAAKLEVPLPENNLDVWNRELERLVH